MPSMTITSTVCASNRVAQKTGPLLLKNPEDA